MHLVFQNENIMTTSTLIKNHKDDHFIYICPGVPRTVAFLTVFVIAFLTYFVSLEGGFVLDDKRAILTNKDLKPETPIYNLFYNDFWGTRLLHNSSHKSYRPLTILSFRLNYLLDGGSLDSAKSYHLTNLFLYSFCSVLSLVIFSNIFDDGSRPRFSFISAIMFSIHPVHTESVAGIVGRADILCAIFYFSSIYIYTQYLKIGSYWRFAASMIFCGISMLCKEQGITVLGVLAVYDVISNHFDLKKMSIITRQTFYRLLWLILVGLILLYGRFTVMGSTPTIFNKWDNPASFSPSLMTRILSYNYIYSINGLLLMWPHWLCFDWSMGCILLIESVRDFRNFSSLIFWIIMTTASLKALFSSSQIQRRNLTLGLALIVIPFLPATNILFRVGFVVAERVLFIPVAGYCIIFVYGLEKLNLIYPNPKLWRGLLISILILYGLKSFRRTLDWKDELQLFQSGLKVCPLNAKVHCAIGNIQQSQHKNYVEAEASYLNGLKLRWEYPECHYNFGNMYLEQKKYTEAEKSFRNAISLERTHALAWTNLIIMLTSNNRLNESEQLARDALKVLPNVPNLNFCLAAILLQQDRFEESEPYFLSAIKLQPRSPMFHTNLGVLYHRWLRFDQAESSYLRALELDPGWKSATENLNLLQKTKQSIQPSV